MWHVISILLHIVHHYCLVLIFLQNDQAMLEEEKVLLEERVMELTLQLEKAQVYTIGCVLLLLGRA